MRYLFLFALLLSCFTCWGQIANIPGAGNEVIRTQKYVDIAGSPYLYEDWKSGSVTDKAGKSFSGVLLKFDAYKNAVEINQNGEIMVLNTELYPKFSVSFAEPGSNKVVNHFFQCGIENIKGSSAKTYFEVVRNGAIQVLKKYEIKFVESNITNYGTSTISKSFQKIERYFIKVTDEYTEIKLNSKSVLEALGDKKNEAEKYMRESKLKIKSEDDLGRLVDHLNSL